MKWALLGALCTVGCGADYETEHLRITTHFDAPLCAGNLEIYEQSIDVLESKIGRSLDTPLDVDLWHFEGWREVSDRHCREDLRGCYRRSSHRIFGVLGTPLMAHELVHAIVRRSTDEMVQEGTAEAWSDWTQFGREQPALVPVGGSVDYTSSGHFMRWLDETRGRACVRALLSVGHGKSEETFSEHCGSSFDAAVDEYADTAPWIYPNPFGCDFGIADEVTLAPEGLDLAVTIDCDDIDTTAHEIGMNVKHRLKVEQAGMWTIWTDSEDSAASVSRCEDEGIEIAPHYWISDDRIPPINSFNLRGNGKGKVGRVWLDPGWYHLSVGVLGWAGPRTVRVRIDPAPPIERVP